MHIGCKTLIHSTGFKIVTECTRPDQGFGVGDRSWAVSGPKVVGLGGFRLSDHAGALYTTFSVTIFNTLSTFFHFLTLFLHFSRTTQAKIVIENVV